MALVTAASELVIEENLKQFLLVLSVSLSVATLPRIFSWLRQVPYTLLLVIVGLGLASVNVRLVNLSPELILLIFLPPILFEAAWNLEWSSLKRDLVPISLFAIGGVVISIACVALSLEQLAGIPLATAILVGASLAATDSVSVIGLFRELGVEKRLTILTEGECLFNDGASVVAFGLLMGLALGAEEFEISAALTQFFTYSGIGIGIGSLIGLGVSYLTQRFDSPLAEQSLTLVTAYGTYLLIEELGGSGVIGVVTVGLILGNFGSRVGMNPQTRLTVTEFWEFLAFFVNSIVFLLIGDQIRFARLVENLGTTGITIGAVILARVIAVYGLGSLSNRIANSQIPLQEQTVLWWGGGLRGSVSIALALSIPINLSGRQEIIANVFGTVLFTLLVQGLTTQPMLEKLGLLNHQALQQKYLEAIARRVALNRVLQRLDQEDSLSQIKPDVYHSQVTLIRAKLSQIEEEIDRLQTQYPQLQDVFTRQLQDELLAIESNTYAELIQAGRLNNELPPLVQEILRDKEAAILDCPK